MDLPAALQTQLLEGRVVLILGAGASREPTPSGTLAPSSQELACLLSDNFLGGKYRNGSLARVAEYCVSESDLVTVQEYIRRLFDGLEPSAAHKLLPMFHWRAPATTNYDRLIERAYDLSTSPLQIPRPFIQDGDRVDDALRDPRTVMLLKLHGCITRTADIRCPLILTPDQYLLYRTGRSRIFDHLRGLAFECPLVFVGHSLEDSDIRALLLELIQSVDSRPRYYAVLPSFEDLDQRLWESKKVTLLRGTFGELMNTLDAAIPREPRRLARLVPADELPVARRLRAPSSALSTISLQFLNTDVDYVSGLKSITSIAPKDFYKGLNREWAPIEQNLDVRRHLGDTLLADNFLIPESAHQGQPEVLLVRAHAGAGKSVLLRRLAWDAAHDYDAFCLFLRPYGSVDRAAVQELLNLTDQRIYLFVDDAANRARELEELFTGIGPEGRRLTVVLAERINEWNTSGQDLLPYVTASYELGYLSTKEIDALLGLLDRHAALGTLQGASDKERRDAFAERAGRQILVALHEATLGRPFEDIIHDEFLHITPLDAQRIYLTICVFNRLGVPVRAGLVARLHGVPFEEFRSRFFTPLEQVVYADFDPTIRDYIYRTRHPHIAEIVFQRVLSMQEERYDLYVRCLKALNIDYSADNRAFRQMVRGRTVLDLFPDHELGRRVYECALELVGQGNPHLLHQVALYEMHRPNGNLSRAADLLNQAASLPRGTQRSSTRPQNID